MESEKEEAEVAELRWASSSGRLSFPVGLAVLGHHHWHRDVASHQHLACLGSLDLWWDGSNGHQLPLASLGVAAVSGAVMCELGHIAAS